MRLKISDQVEAHRIANSFPFVVSTLDWSDRVPEKLDTEHHKVVRMEDSEDPEFGPTSSDIREILDLVPLWGLTKESEILVHCWAGLSRSTATAWALLVKVGFSVEEAKSVLLEVRPNAWPNLLILEHADNLLGLDGELLKAGREIDQAKRMDGWPGSSG